MKAILILSVFMFITVFVNAIPKPPNAMDGKYRTKNLQCLQDSIMAVSKDYPHPKLESWYENVRETLAVLIEEATGCDKLEGLDKVACDHDVRLESKRKYTSFAMDLRMILYYLDEKFKADVSDKLWKIVIDCLELKRHE